MLELGPTFDIDLRHPRIAGRLTWLPQAILTICRFQGLWALVLAVLSSLGSTWGFRPACKVGKLSKDGRQGYSSQQVWTACSIIVV